MTNDTSEDTDADAVADGGEITTRLFQMKDELFWHRMALKNHDHQLITAEERLILTVISSLSTAFGFIAIGLAAAVGVGMVPLAEGYELLEQFFMTLGMLAALLIALMSALTGEFGIISTIMDLREGIPEPEYDIDNLEPEQTQNGPQKQTGRDD